MVPMQIDTEANPPASAQFRACALGYLLGLLFAGLALLLLLLTVWVGSEVAGEVGARRVNFVIGGTQKGGTSSLRHALNEHPSISLHATGRDPLF